MRQLSQKFMDDLNSGPLKGILDCVKADDTLLLQIRENYINIYYRGCSALKLTETANGYKAEIHEKYTFSKSDSVEDSETLSNPEDFDAKNWLEKLPNIKRNIDCNLGAKRRSEREFQQLVARENSFSEIANGTDYFIIDIERATSSKDSASSKARFDMVAIKWPATSAGRKNPTECRLALIEMKYGNDSFGNLEDHYEHIKDFIDKNEDSIKEEALSIFRQLRALGLVELSENNKNEVEKLPNKVEFILLCANLSPNSTKNQDIKTVAEKYKESNKIEYRFATASFMGYAFYDKFMLKHDEFFKLLEKHNQK